MPPTSNQPSDKNANPAPSAPVPAENPPVSGQQPNPVQKKKNKYLALAIVFGIPLLFLAYRLIVGAYYSPGFFYNKDHKKAEAKAEKVIPQIDQKFDEIDTALFQLAVTIPAYSTSSGTSDNGTEYKRDQTGSLVLQSPRPLSSTSIPTQGKLTVFDDKKTQHACQAVTIMGGTKFDTHPVGQRMSCKYGSEKLYEWTGSRDQLDVLIGAVQAQTGVVAKLDRYEPMHNDTSDKPVIRLISDSYSTFNDPGLITSGADWEKIFKNDVVPRSSTSSTPYNSNRHWLTLSVTSEYYVFFQRDL